MKRLVLGVIGVLFVAFCSQPRPLLRRTTRTSGCSGASSRSTRTRRGPRRRRFRPGDAVVDAGVDLNHPDLKAKLLPGATFTGCATNGPCGNGDWQSGNTTGARRRRTGRTWQGSPRRPPVTASAVAGVAPDAQILPVKLLTEDGGTFEEIAAGIRWATDHGADVINLSLGAVPGVQALALTGLLSDARDAIDYAYAPHGVVVVVAAAGNDFASICGEPGFNAHALCIVATDPREVRASYSNFAVQEGMNVVAAPGGAGLVSCTDDVISTRAPAGAEGICSGGAPATTSMRGTSMATPHVAGVAALLTAQGRSVDNVFRILKSTARTPGAGTRGTFTPAYGYGIVDATAAVASQ